MDPSATLLSLLHRNQTPPSEPTMAGQKSPTTPSYPSSQPTPPPIQSSPNPMPIFNYPQPFNTQPLAYNQNVFPPATVPPPPPPPPPPMQLSSQSQMSTNPIASLLQTLNTNSIPPSSQETSISASGTPHPQQIFEKEATISTGPGDPTLLNVDQAVTDSLKLALFGSSSATSFDESQQENKNQYLADTSLPQDENPPEEEITYPEETAEVEEVLTPAEEFDYNKNLTLESIKPTASSPKQSPPTSNKSMFTYTNPFDLLKKSPPPSPSQSATTTTQWSSQSTSTSQKKREVPVVQKDNGVFSRPLQQVEPFLSELSAWNVRANSSSKAHSGTSDGVRLPRGTLLYNTGKKNENVLSSKDLELTTITLVPSELEYRAGKLISVNALYICYTVKGGKIRVISTLYGSKTLLRNHDKSILDMCIQDVLPDEFKEEEIETQLLLAVGGDSKITVWELSEPPPEQEVEIPCKILLEINSKEPTDDSKSPRYHRAVWHPVNRNMFAVATDTNDVLVIDISKILEGTEKTSFKESDISGKILKSQMHDKPINDLAFSPDGTILATASDDSVIFWELKFENDVGINPVRKIILDGQQVSSVLFIDGEDLSSDRSFKFRYVIFGTERNTILHLYDVESDEYIQSIKFLPPPERRPSLNKANRKEEAMFNCVSFDREFSTLFIANSARISIFALHLNLPQKRTEQLYDQTTFGTSSQIEYDSTSSVDGPTGSKFVQFDYMIEFPVNQLIGSFVVVPDTNTSQGISLYCFQSKAVQQYHIAKYLLLPPNLDVCPEYVSAEMSLDLPQQEEVEDTSKEEQNKFSITETSESSSHSEGAQLSTTEEGNIEKDIVKETVIVETTNTVEEYGSESTTLVIESEDTSLNEKNIVQESTTGNIIESTVNSDENESKTQESQKTSSVAKLSSVVNGTISRLKEKKKPTASSSIQNNELLSDSERTSRKSRRGMERDKDSGNENMNHSPETTKATGKKSADGVLKNNGKIGSGAGERKRALEPQEGQSSTLSPATGISPAQMQIILKEIKKVEDSVTNKLGKMFSKELEKQFQKIEEERIAERIEHQAAETSRQEAILKIVSQSLTTNTSKLLESTIRSEIQNSVLPNLSKMVTNSVDKHAHRGMVDAVNKNIPTAIDKAVSDNVPRVLSKAPVIDSIAKGVSKSIRPVIEETFRENFTSVLIPSYQKATNAMFEQITTTFETGLQDIAHKSAQSASYSNAHGIDQSTLARLQASIDHLTMTVQQLQANVNNANVVGRQISGKMVEQQLGRSSDEQHQRARSLSGELKRILIPQSTTSAPTPSMTHQEAYNYTPTVGAPSSQSHSQMHQQQLQQQLQHQIRQHQHQQQQLLSPVEPPGLEENSSNADRFLEMRNYEEAFVTILATHDLPSILRLCNKVNPKSVFPPSRVLLSQPVILSLIHHLSLELNKFPELKRAWVEEAVVKLNPKDHDIREHCERILPMVKQRLEEYYIQLASQDPQNPNLNKFGILIHALGGLLS